MLRFVTTSLIFFCFSLITCSKHTALIAPEENEQDSDIVEPEYQPPGLFPLAHGSIWQYKLDYHSISTTVTDSDKKGSLELKVIDETVIEDSRKFLVQTRVIIDKAIYRKLISYPGGITLSDTTYTLFNTLDTTYLYNITLYRDTLWYDNKGSLEYMMATEYPEYAKRGQADLKLFSCPLVASGFQPGLGSIKRITADTSRGKVNTVRYRFVEPFFQGDITAYFVKPINDWNWRDNRAGLWNLTWWKHEGGTITYTYEKLTLDLISYKSGQPVE